MTDLGLASAGDDIKIWDCNTYSLLKQYNPHRSNVSCITWSDDNAILCSASSSGDKVVLNYTGLNVTREITEQPGRTCVAFNSTSRYVAGGGLDGKIFVWDLKASPYKLKKSYTDHKAAVTAVQFNWNDSVIASGSESGEIILFNVVTGLGSAPLAGAQRLQAVRQLQYSHFRKSLLASASDDGTVALWDASARRPLLSFQAQHRAPATALAFSPINEMLLTSVGLDKRIVCYDVQNGTALRTMLAESPLTAVDILHDGATLAVGSTRGKVCIYDLRAGTAPVRALSAHKASVQGLRFQHKASPAPSKASSKASKAAKASLRQDDSANHHLNGSAERIPAPSALHDSDRLRMSEDGVFSPLKDRPSRTPLKSRSTRSLSRDRRRGKTVDDNGSLAHSDAGAASIHSGFSDNLEGGVFSPVVDDVSQGFTRSHSAFALNVSPVSTLRPTTDTSLDRRSLDGLAAHVEAELRDPASRPSSRGSSTASLRADSERETKRPLRTPYELPIRDTEGGARGAGFLSDESLSSRINRHRSSDPVVKSPVKSLPTPPDAMPSAEFSARDVGEESDSSRSGAGAEGVNEQLARGAGGFQVQFVRNLMDDALEDFREEMRRDMLNLHMEVIKQSQVIQMQVEALARQFSLNEELKNEVVRLREENRKLQRKF